MKLKNLLLIIIFTTIFTFLIFLIRSYFFLSKEDLENKIIEEKYIDYVAEQIIEPTVLNNNDEQISDEEVELNSAKKKVEYTYIPKNFWNEKDAKNYTLLLDTFLNYYSIEKILTFLDVIINKERWEVRWKMQDKKVKLFWIYEMRLSEFLAVSIHEFAHFYDLYILQKKNWIDISDYFYDISWQETKIIKPTLTKKDFVSWYSMTNKYEDFAETFTYYVLHNSDFLEKSKTSEILKKKYNFFSKYIFYDNEFTDSSLISENEILDYYRDTTKIEYSLQNFLQYIKN